MLDLLPHMFGVSCLVLKIVHSLSKELISYEIIR